MQRLDKTPMKFPLSEKLYKQLCQSIKQGNDEELSELLKQTNQNDKMVLLKIAFDEKKCTETILNSPGFDINGVTNYDGYEHDDLPRTGYINYISGYRSSILSHALEIANNDTEYLKFILSNGYNINQRDCNGDISFYKDMDDIKVEILKCLVDHGADIYSKNSDGSTLLFILTRSTCWDIAGETECTNENCIKYLLDKGLDVNALDNDGYSSLYWAKHICRPDVMKILIDHGADLYVKYNTIEGHMGPKNKVIILDHVKYIYYHEKKLTNKVEMFEIVKDAMHKKLMEKLTQKVVTGVTEYETVFPFPTAGGHIMLFKTVCDYSIDSSRNDDDYDINK